MQVTPSKSLVSALFSKNIADLRARSETVAQEAVTGKHADLTKHLGGRIGNAMLAQKAVDDITAQREQLDLRAARLTIAQRSLGQIHGRVDGIDVRMLSALGLGDTAGRNVAARDAAAALEDAFTALNVRHGDRFLFSGEATATAPFGSPEALLSDIRQLAAGAPSAAAFEAAVDTYFNDPAGPWQTAIYRGTPNPADAESVTATDPALTELISGLAILALSGTDENIPVLRNSPAIVEAAAGRITSGRTALTALRAEIGIHEERIARSQVALDTEETVLKGLLETLTGRDQYEAASELKQIEAGLEASYLLTTRLSNLTLLNFLR
ncbi:flagellin [Hyphomonas sp.]|uniref:flagellin n=1 Tax=Hyphomonas sp. TaxID=87 RepID=UPI0039197326